ncbi:MAG: F420-dependent glucose-6-phosphate dehydrogenase [Steroidobacteraceae bacterium]|nr:F420-dependent glucose-6-phosphate dehydrogenase [Steroidobacteraceae bacterium]
MVQVAIGLYGLQQWFGGDFAPVVDLARRAEQAGVDQVSITDHVVMGEHLDKYPYGKFPSALDFPWFEPLTVLAAIAGATQRIRLSTGILIAPLRPAVLLAKQLATLDVMSRGRVTIGLGLGWQREEYDAAGVPWEGRYTRLEEQVRVCKLLWSEAPASFNGETVRFERIHAWPRPVQEGGVPIWFGLAPTERNIDRIAALGDGWIPMEQRPERLAVHVDKLRAAFAARGRDPRSLAVRVVLRAVFRADGSPDLDATLAAVPALAAAGVTMVEVLPLVFCRGPQDFDAFCERMAGVKKS